MINNSSSIPSAHSSSPGRPVKRRIFPHAPPTPKTITNATDRYCTSPPDLESTPDSESAKGHPELLVSRQLLPVTPLTTTIRQKYRMIRLKHMIPILLFLAAGVPFIVHLKLGTGMQQQKQQAEIDKSKWHHQNISTLKREKLHRLHLLDTQEDEFLTIRKRGHFLRYSNKKSLMKFHSTPERQATLSPWNLLLPSTTETIKLDDGMTVSLKSGFAGNVTVFRGSHVQESSDDVKQLNPGDENDSNADNTASSQDVTHLLTSETAAWEPDQECVPMSDWQTTFKPTCNSLHEMDMPFLLNKEAYSLVSNKGFWRNAWKVDMSVVENGMSPVSNIVIKSLKYIHDPNDETFELNRVDGVSMEQLTQSRYITDIYGYCGTTSLQEFAGGGNLAKFLPKLKPLEKLGMAAWVSAGVADIHEVGKKATGNNTITASLIHNDINMDNILLGYRDGIRVPLINDFNIAIFRKKDAKSGAPCKFRGRFFNPQWMAPEQMVTEDKELSVGFINEKIDVYALGNILYKVAVGNSPWKYNFNKAKKILEEHKEKITRTKLKGGKPKVPDEIKNSIDPSIQAVLTAMDKCYRNEPDVRPSAREISDYLKKKFLSLGRK